MQARVKNLGPKDDKKKLCFLEGKCQRKKVQQEEEIRFIRV